jgi:putative ABC transport system permease protein
MADAYLWRLAARNALRNRRRSFFTLTSILLGVSLFIVSRSFVDGIDATLIAIEVDNESAHVRVVPTDYLKEEDYQPLDLPFPDVPGLSKQLMDLAPGTRVVDRVSFAAEVGDGRRTLRCRGLVVDRDAYKAVFPVGELPVPPGDEPYLWAGSGIADTFGWKPGDRIFLKAKTRRGTLNALDAVRFAGAISTGHPFVDNYTVVLPRHLGAEFLDLPADFATEVLARFPEPALALAAERLVEAPGSVLTAETWEERTADFRAVNQIRRAAFNIVVALILMMGAAGVANTGLMSAIERTREIGTLMAIGLAPARVRKLMTIEAVLIAVVGAVLGVLLGSLVAHHFAVHGLHFPELQQAENVSLVPPVLFFDLSARTVGMAAAFGIGTALIAAIWPAVRASRLSPIEALREDD